MKTSTLEPQSLKPTRLKIKKKKDRARLDSPEMSVVKEAPASEAPREAVAFHALRVVPAARQEYTPLPATKRYWVGVFSDAPFDNKHFSGVTFQKYTGTLESDPKTGELILDRASAGCVIDLDDLAVERALLSIARSVIRTVGNRADATGNYRCDRFDVSIPGYRPSKADKPVGKYLYMVEVNRLMPMDWREQRPPALVAEFELKELRDDR